MVAEKLCKDVSVVAASYLCNSCGACFAACNRDAISYRETVGGYLFPEIDDGKCTQCGLCYDICPGRQFGKTLSAEVPDDPFIGTIKTCEVGRSTDANVFANSQSGGVATALLMNLFETGKIEAAIVAVMKKNCPPRGDMFVARNAADLISAQKSKYTPIPMLKALRDLKSMSGTVALVGLPCHMHGLINLQDKFPVYKKLTVLKIGLICDRVMTSTAIDFMSKKATKGGVAGFIFRDKSKPSYPGNPVVCTDDGRTIVLSASLRMAVKDFFTPVRCRLCFDKLNIYSDIVLGDPHGVPDVDRKHGETLVFSRTDRGRDVVKSARDAGAVVLRDAPLKDALTGQLIDRKRHEWSSYMQAWSEMERPLPVYSLPPVLTESAVVTRGCQQRLHAGLKLDDFSSRKMLMSNVDRWMFLGKVKRRVVKLAGRLKAILSRLAGVFRSS